MSLTFRAAQIESNKLIASGSTGTPTGAKLLIYPHEADDATSPNQGFIDQTIFNTGSIGTDIFLYVSGGIGKKNVGGSQAITVFGGDVHISGNLSVAGTYPSGGGGGGGNDYWVSVAPNDIRTTGSIYIDAGAYNGNLIEFDNSGSGATIRVADNTAAGLSPGDLDMFIRAGSDFLNGGTTGGTTWIYGGDGADKVPGEAANGGDVIVNAGNGGDGASAFPGPKDGGNGGTILIQGGSGGTGVNVGGDGGSVIIGAGSGNIDVSGSGDGGGGGSVSLAAGTGASATNTAGTGGTFQIVAGDGGDGFDGASGGTVAIYAGAGGDGFGGSAAVGGSIQIVAGSPGFDNIINAPTGSGPILIAGGLHSETFHYESGSNMSVGIPFGFGQTFNLTRIFFNRSADPDYAATNGLPLPTDISDVFFFVSGNIGGKDGSIPTVALFGGDVVVSGNLHLLGGITGSNPGVEAYWASEAAGEIFTSASLVNVPSGSVHAQFLSSSNGAEISGSVLVDLSQGPNFSFVISGSGNGLPAFDVVSPGNIPGEEHSMFVVDPTNNRVRALSLDPSNYINMELGTPALQVISGVHQIDLNPNFDRIAFFVSASAATGSISVIDDNSNIGELQLEATTLNLYINGLAINGDPGVAGYVLTSQGAGTSPIWVAAGGGGLATGKQYIASATTTTTTTALMIGQFSWVPSDYTGLTSVTVRAIMSTDGTANHTGSLQIYNLTSGSYLDLVDTPTISAYFDITSSIPTLVTSSNLLTGITNFDNSSIAVYEVRVSGSTANNTIIGGVELIFS